MVLPMRGMSETSLSSVEELIGMTFSEADGQKIDFRVMHALLLVMARTLNMLERQVIVKISGVQSFVSTVTLAISEVRIVAKGKKGKGKKGRDVQYAQGDQDVDGSGGKRGASKPQKTDSDDQLYEKDDGRRYSADESAAKSAKFEKKRRSPDAKDVGRGYSADEPAAKSAKSEKEKAGQKRRTKETEAESLSPSSSERKEAGQKRRTKETEAGLLSPSSSERKEAGQKRRTKETEAGLLSPSSSERKEAGQKRRTKETEAGLLSPSSSERKEVGQKRRTKKAEAGLLSSSSSELSDMQEEKLIIVETIQAGEIGKHGTLRRGERDRLESIVTQEQFNSVLNNVINIKKRFGVDIPGFQDIIDILHAMSKQYPITDPMAILQLSARLEYTERAIDTVMGLLRELAKRTIPGYEELAGQQSSKTEKKGGKVGKITKITSKKDFFSDENQAPDHDDHRTAEVKLKKAGDNAAYVPSETSFAAPTLYKEVGSEQTIDQGDSVKFKTYITRQELKQNVGRLEEEIRKEICYNPKDADVAINVQKTSAYMGTKLSRGTDHLPDKMNELENLLSATVNKVYKDDEEFAEIMMTYQEELTNMAETLDEGLENMTEALANRVSDDEGIKDLINKMTAYQAQIMTAGLMQRKLDYYEAKYKIDLKHLTKLLKELQEAKSDRDEVEEALKTKAGINLLNGKVSKIQFEAVQGHFQKSISASFIKYNSAENGWQKMIEESFRALNEKATHFQLKSYQDNVAAMIEMLNDRLDTMLEVCGEALTDNRTKTIICESKCLSCQTLTVGSGEPGAEGKSPKLFGGKGGEDEVKGKDFGDGDGERHICYPTMPVRHALHPRSRICTRYCGGPVKVDEKDKQGIAKCMSLYYEKDKEMKQLEPHKRPKTDDTVPCGPCKRVKEGTIYSSSGTKLSYAEDEDLGQSKIGIDSRAIIVEDL